MTVYTETSRAWKFSPHAIVRLAERLGLLIDMAVEAQISNALNSSRAKLIRANYGRVLYEIPILGVPMVAVCDREEHVVVTFMDAKKWHKKLNCRRTRHKDFRPKESKESIDEEE